MTQPTDPRNPANVSVAKTLICLRKGHVWKMDSFGCIRCGLLKGYSPHSFEPLFEVGES